MIFRSFSLSKIVQVLAEIMLQSGRVNPSYVEQNLKSESEVKGAIINSILHFFLWSHPPNLLNYRQTINIYVKYIS